MNYLIVKTSSLGDVIQTFPVVEYLKSKDPHCRIDWVVEEEYAPLLRAHPGISIVLTLASRRWRDSFLRIKSLQEVRGALSALKNTFYDVVFDLQGNTKSALLTFSTRAHKKVGFGWGAAAEWPNYLATDERFSVAADLPIQRRYLSVVQQFFNDAIPFYPQGVQLLLTPQDAELLASFRKYQKPRIMVAFGSKWENKCLSFSTLVQFLEEVEKKERCIFYFVSGTSQEKEIGDRLSERFPSSLSLQGLSFPLCQRLMGEVDLVIATDSAALALCGTTPTASFSFFGPTQSSIYKPLGAHHRHYQGACPYNVQFSSRCPHLRTCSSGACLKQAAPADLVRRYDEKRGDGG